MSVLRARRFGENRFQRREIEFRYRKRGDEILNAIWVEIHDEIHVMGRRWLITACAGFYGLPDLVSVLVFVADPMTPKLLLHLQLRMEPMVGIEPTTYGLRNRCSTTELHWLKSL